MRNKHQQHHNNNNHDNDENNTMLLLASYNNPKVIVHERCRQLLNSLVGDRDDDIANDIKLQEETLRMENLEGFYLHMLRASMLKDKLQRAAVGFVYYVVL